MAKSDAEKAVEAIADGVKGKRKKAELPTMINHVELINCPADELFEYIRNREELIYRAPDIAKMKLEIRAIRAEISRRMGG